MRDFRQLGAISRLVTGALVALAMPFGAARADDPNDATMRSGAAIARDHEVIRQLNQQQLDYVQRRDAQYAQGWRDYRAAQGEDATAPDGEPGPLDGTLSPEDDAYAARVYRGRTYVATRASGAQADYDRRRADYDSRRADYERDRAAYDAERTRYERSLADWRDRVSACNAGDYAACE